MVSWGGGVLVENVDFGLDVNLGVIGRGPIGNLVFCFIGGDFFKMRRKCLRPRKKGEGPSKEECKGPREIAWGGG